MVAFKQVKRNTVLWLLMVLQLAMPAYGQRGHTEAAQQSKELLEAVGVDDLGRLGVVEYDPPLLEKLLEGVESPDVRIDALNLLTRVLRQWKLPPEALDAIASKVRRLQGEPWARDQVKLMEWHLRLLRAKREETKLAVAKEGLRSGWLAMMPVAINFFVQRGDEVAKAHLEEAKREKLNHSDKDLAHRLELGLEMIEVNKALAGRREEEQVEFLFSVFQEYVQRKLGWGTQEFVLWVIGKIDAIDSPQAVSTLKQIYESKEYGDDRIYYRYAAQEALVRKGELLPEQRKVIFLSRK
jgi:hypothetical protein